MDNYSENIDIIPLADALGQIHLKNSNISPITVIGTHKIRSTFDQTCLQQAINSRLAPGVTDLILNPDAHVGYGAPVGCVLNSRTHIYPGPVGVDIKCSMSLLQTDLPNEEIKDRATRRAIINALLARLPTGAGKGQRSAPKARKISLELGKLAATEGASRKVCSSLGVPFEWTAACEDAQHFGHKGSFDSLTERLNLHINESGDTFIFEKMQQLGSYGGGNHFGEANNVTISNGQDMLAQHFGLLNNRIAYLSHCGSRGFGYYLAQKQFKVLQQKFERENIAFPGKDRELVYAELGTGEADNYLDDLALGANFATVNHLLINALALEAFQEIFPGLKGELVYFISHNIARKEIVNGLETWVHRKGATRAFPANHPGLNGTKYSNTGHPILLPGNPISGSAVMVAAPNANISCFSINHGAGRQMSRTKAKKDLQQAKVDSIFDQRDILSNCRHYPLDEAPDAYKDFNEVLLSVEKAGLANKVATLNARFVIKDGDKSNNGAA